MNRKYWTVFIIAGVSVCLIVCVSLVFFGLIGAGLWTTSWAIDNLENGSPVEPSQTPVLLRPTPGNGATGEGLELDLAIEKETLETLSNTEVPINDLRDLARRLEGIENIPLTLEPPTTNLELGMHEDFWVANVDTNENFQVTAVLQYITDHVYFWVGEDVEFEEEELAELAETFENEIYPTTREFFGSEWSPGVDGDPHLYLLYVDGLGERLAGYFSSADEQNPLAHEYSNAHEMFLLNADNLDLDEEFTYGVLAHEFQHMIHWNRDRNEASWVNEGFSELAVLLNEFRVDSDRTYIRDPDIQLNDWPNNSGETGPHYGAAFLFLTYFLDRFGEEATRALVAEPDNGLEGIDQTLENLDVVDPETNKPITTEDLFFDWILASYLLDDQISDGRFTYHVYPDAPQASATETITSCPRPPLTRDVSQFGVDYLQITCSGNFKLNFTGSTQARVVPAGPFSGDYAFWSNKGDESDLTLTREFDFSGYSGPLTLTFRTWFDLEEDYDYTYLVASEDGEHWDILTTPTGTAEDPSGNSFGWGYNGYSGGWITEEVDLSAFAGKKVQLRFEYVTDAAVNGEGMLIDDVRIPEIDYFADFEKDAGGWDAAGWVRIQNSLPQTFRLALITFAGDTTTVEQIPVGSDVEAEIDLILEDRDEAVLVVSGTTRFTRQNATYRIEITP